MPDLFKSSRVRDIQVEPDGALIVFCSLMVMEGDAILGSRTHAHRIEPGADIDQSAVDLEGHFTETGLAFVNPKMLNLGSKTAETVVNYPAIPSEDFDRIKAKASEVWTPEVLAAAQAKREALQAANDALEVARQERLKGRTEAQAQADEAAEAQAKRDDEVKALVNAALAAAGVKAEPAIGKGKP